MPAVPMDRIRRLLVDSVGFDRGIHELKTPASTPPQATSTTESAPVAFIFRRYGTQPLCVKIANEHWTHDVRPVVLLRVESGNWEAEPFMLLPEFRKDPHLAVAVTVSADDVWIRVLLSLVEDEFRRLPQPASFHAPTARMNLEQVFREKIRRYLLQGPKGFFDDSEGRKWLIASRWDRWNRAAVIWKNRWEEIKNARYALDERNFKRLCTETLELKYDAPRAGLGGKHR